LFAQSIDDVSRQANPDASLMYVGRTDALRKNVLYPVQRIVELHFTAANGLPSATNGNGVSASEWKPLSCGGAFLRPRATMNHVWSIAYCHASGPPSSHPLVPAIRYEVLHRHTNRLSAAATSIQPPWAVIALRHSRRIDGSKIAEPLPDGFILTALRCKLIRQRLLFVVMFPLATYALRILAVSSPVHGRLQPDCTIYHSAVR